MTGTCGCGRTWTSLTECHCRTCHRQFTSVTAFDRHQPGRYRCPDPDALLERNGDPTLRRIDRSGGDTWTLWTSDEDRAAMRQRLATAPRKRPGAAPRSP
jgi:hypothetical protein